MKKQIIFIISIVLGIMLMSCNKDKDPIITPVSPTPQQIYTYVKDYTWAGNTPNHSLTMVDTIYQHSFSLITHPAVFGRTRDTYLAIGNSLPNDTGRYVFDQPVWNASMKYKGFIRRPVLNGIGHILLYITLHDTVNNTTHDFTQCMYKRIN